MAKKKGSNFQYPGRDAALQRDLKKWDSSGKRTAEKYGLYGDPNFDRYSEPSSIHGSKGMAEAYQKLAKAYEASGQMADAKRCLQMAETVVKRPQYKPSKNDWSGQIVEGREIAADARRAAAMARVGGARSRFDVAETKYGDSQIGDRVRRRELELTAATASIIGLIGGIFFFSSNITGNVIGLNQTSTNWIGGVLFIVGLIGAFAFFRKRK